jgi:hypothetical protein
VGERRAKTGYRLAQVIIRVAEGFPPFFTVFESSERSVEDASSGRLAIHDGLNFVDANWKCNDGKGREI